MSRISAKRSDSLNAISAAVALFCLMVSRDAHAQSNESPAPPPGQSQAAHTNGVAAQPVGQDLYARTVAEGLYDEADAAMARNDFTSACPKLEKVVQMVSPGIGAKLTLGECYEGSGKLASAWMSYTSAANAAFHAGQVERQREAQELADALKPRIAQLKILVPQPMQALPGLEIRRDGVLVESWKLGVALPMDKGIYSIVVTATDRQREQRTIEIKSDGVTYSMAFTELRRVAAVEIVPPKPVVERAGESVRSAPAPNPAPAPIMRRDEAPFVAATGLERVESPSNAQRNIGGVMAGVGFISAVVCASLGIKALQTDGDVSIYKTSALVTGVAGAGLLTIGVALLATAPSTPQAPTARLAVGPRGVALHGTW